MVVKLRVAACRLSVGRVASSSRVAHNQLRPCVRDDACGELGRASRIERHNEDSAQQAAEEDADPHRGVLAPEHDSDTGDDMAVFELGGEASGQLGERTVGGGITPVAAVSHHRRLRRMLAKLFHETGEVSAHRS